MARAASAGDFSNALILLAKRVFAGGGDPHDSEHLISSAGGSRAGCSKPAPTKDEQKRAYIIEALRLARDASQAITAPHARRIGCRRHRRRRKRGRGRPRSWWGGATRRRRAGSWVGRS